MIQAYTLQCTCTSPGTIQGQGGAEAHALLFSLWKQLDSARAGRLHDASEKPFSLRLDLATPDQAGRQTALTEGQDIRLTLGTLTTEMSNLAEALPDLARSRNLPLGTSHVRLTGFHPR